MQEKGIVTDAAVLKTVLERPGITVHEIADKLGWTNGKADGSVNRLNEKGKVRIQHYLRRKALIKKIYPAEYRHGLSGVIEIPKGEIVESVWKDKVHVYSLSRASIAISPKRSKEWERKALWKGTAVVEKTGTKLFVMLPTEVSSFYRLENSETSLSTSDDFTLVTVESTVVPVDLPPSYSETSILRKTRYVILMEQIEQIGITSNIGSSAFYGIRAIDKESRILREGSSEPEINTLLAKEKGDKRSTTTQKAEIPIRVIVK